MSQSSPLGKIEGKYEIVAKITEGGMGSLYKVRHQLLGDLRVVKVMRAELMSDPISRERFHREAKAAIRLNHPNIARLYDFTVDDDGAAFIVMELIHGMALDEVLAEGVPPIPLALEIAEQSLRAIGHLHREGLLHRDVSPDNLMLGRDVDGKPLVKLIDLGLVKPTSSAAVSDSGAHRSLTASNVFVGKFRYAAPEQFRADDEIGPASDLYSFGLVLYELLTGVYPIVGEDSNPSSLIAGHLFRPPLDFAITDPKHRISSALREVLQRSLHKEPEQRWKSAEEFAAALAPLKAAEELETSIVRQIVDDARAAETPIYATREISHEVTQELLDRKFQPEATPLPSARAPEAPGLVSTQAAIDLDVTGAGASVAEEIGTHLDAGHLETAREMLRSARRELGSTPTLEVLAGRLHGMENLQHRPRVLRLLREARGEADAGRYTEAMAVVERAEELAPTDPQVRDMAERLQRESRRRQLERERRRLVHQAVEEIEELISEDRLDEADEALRRAGEQWGRDERFPGLRQLIEARRVEPTRPHAAQSAAASTRLVDMARFLAQTEDFEESNRLLDQALELEPDHTAGRLLQVGVTACLEAQQIARERKEHAVGAVGDIENLLVTGNLDRAVQELWTAEHRFGENSALRRLKSELIEAQIRAEDAPASSPEPPPPSEPPPSSEPPASAPQASSGDRRFDDLTLMGQLPAPQAPSPPPLPPPVVHASGPASVLEQGAVDQTLRGHLPAPEAPPLYDPQAPQESSGRWIWIVVLLLVIAFGMLGVFLAQQGGEAAEPALETIEIEEVVDPLGEASVDEEAESR